MAKGGAFLARVRARLLTGFAGESYINHGSLAAGSQVLGDVLVRVDVVAGDAASAPVLGVERATHWTPSWSRCSWSLCSRKSGMTSRSSSARCSSFALRQVRTASHQGWLPGQPG